MRRLLKLTVCTAAVTAQFTLFPGTASAEQCPPPLDVCHVVTIYETDPPTVVTVCCPI